MAGPEPLIEAVVFDVGETLIDETRAWTAWADHLGVPALTFLGVLGGAIQRGEDHRTPFRVFAPGLDLRAVTCVAGITDVGIPVYARGVTPNSPFKHGPGTIGLPVM